MDITFTKDSFSKVKLFIATPMYGGMCMSNYLRGMMDLSSACIAYHIPMTLHGVVNESLVQKARNYCVATFLQSDFTHLLFIDADVGFTANDALSLLHLVNTDREKKYDVLAGAYPKKEISWRKVKCAIEKGFADQDPNSLENYIGNYPFFAPPGKPFFVNKPAEVLKISTGFMLIPRRTFEKLMQASSENTYNGPNGTKQFAFFDTEINSDTRLFSGEDYFFCHTLKKIGGRIWLAPWLNLSHQGKYLFTESQTPSLV